METTSGVLYGLEATIRAKLVAIGATSREKAVSSQEAHFNLREQNWLDYIAGGMFALVKKTGDRRFYVAI